MPFVVVAALRCRCRRAERAMATTNRHGQVSNTVFGNDRRFSEPSLRFASRPTSVQRPAASSELYFKSSFDDYDCTPIIPPCHRRRRTISSLAVVVS